MPTLLLSCSAEELPKVTIILSVYTYPKVDARSRVLHRSTGSKLRGTVQLRLGPPDASGRISLSDAYDLLPAGCTAPPAPPSPREPTAAEPPAAQSGASLSAAFPQGPFRMVHCSSAQPFALAFALRADLANDSSPKPKTHYLTRRVSSLPGVHALLRLGVLTRPDRKTPAGSPPQTSGPRRGVSDPQDLRVSRAFNESLGKTSSLSEAGGSGEDHLGVAPSGLGGRATSVG